jgi:hypothetical protein
MRSHQPEDEAKNRIDHRSDHDEKTVAKKRVSPNLTK